MCVFVSNNREQRVPKPNWETQRILRILATTNLTPPPPPPPSSSPCLSPRFLPGGAGVCGRLGAHRPQAEGEERVHRAGDAQTGAPQLRGHPLHPPLGAEVGTQRINTTLSVPMLSLPPLPPVPTPPLHAIALFGFSFALPLAFSRFECVVFVALPDGWLRSDRGYSKGQTCFCIKSMAMSGAETAAKPLDYILWKSRVLARAQFEFAQRVTLGTSNILTPRFPWIPH